MKTTKALLGGGCFWCLDAAFRQVQGVHSVTSGYAGGARPAPNYEQVCSGASGHAEVVELEFDADIISFRELLDIFFAIHDPTTLNRQGHDVGTQYRSVIFFHDEGQHKDAQEAVQTLQEQHVFSAAVVTEISAAPVFYPAEEYHQDFFARNPGQGYCQLVVAPKLAKFRSRFTTRLKD